MNWNTVYTLLVELAGAPESHRMDFIAAQSSEHPPEEWRFSGDLGFGGKYRRDLNKVTAYAEDCTPEIEAAINVTNAALSELS